MPTSILHERKKVVQGVQLMMLQTGIVGKWLSFYFRVSFCLQIITRCAYSPRTSEPLM